MLLESGCAEQENLKGKFSLLQENFHFSGSDGCLAERSKARQYRSRQMKAFSKKKRA